MATLSAVIVPAKVLKNGRHKVRIAVAHNSQTRYILTNITIDSISEFRNGSITRRPDAPMLNTKLRGILQEYQDKVDDIPYHEALTCAELVYALKNGVGKNISTIGEAYEEYIENLVAKPSSIFIYRRLWASLKKHIDPDKPLRTINYSTIAYIENQLSKRKLSDATINNNMVLLGSILRYAQRCGYVEYKRNPFEGYTQHPDVIRDCWLSVDQIKQIRDLQIKSKTISKWRDMFMLSYYLGGINLIDLAKINFKEMNGRLKYIRTKTERQPKINKYVEFIIPDKANEIITRYMDNDGLLQFPRKKRSIESLRDGMAYAMRRISDTTHIKNLLFYSARKSFSQHAFKLGVSTAVIDYILGHSLAKGGSSLFNYIEVTPDMATKAVREVLDNLK